MVCCCIIFIIRGMEKAFVVFLSAPAFLVLFVCFVVNERIGNCLLAGTDEKNVDIYSGDRDESATKYEQFFSIDIPCVGALDGLLKEHKKGRCREKYDESFLHPANDENNAAAHHEYDDIRIFQQRQRINPYENLVEPVEIQLYYC
jgi:hypothetical protein